MTEKLQKILANAGLGSRRQIEEWIREGRVTVNRKTATIGDRATLSDKIAVDGQEVKLIKSQEQKSRVLLYHKPEGQICTRKDPENRPSIFENLPPIRNARWIIVGRLDLNTSGLLLVTNDGALANHLMHPSSEIEREYAVRVRGDINAETLGRLSRGVMLEDGVARFKEIIEAGGKGSNQWYHVTVTEGRNRLVRRMFESQRCQVSRLMRIRFGTILLPKGLREGHCLELTAEEVRELKTLGSAIIK